jgi:hypothetical protein
MKKHQALIGIFAIFLCVILSGCNQISDLFLSDEDKLVGTWNTDGILMDLPTVLEFFSNGTTTAKVEMGTIDFSVNDGKWDMNQGTLTLEIGDLIPLTTYSYQFSEENRLLTLTDNDGNDSFILTKK